MAYPCARRSSTIARTRLGARSSASASCSMGEGWRRSSCTSLSVASSSVSGGGTGRSTPSRFGPGDRRWSRWITPARSSHLRATSGWHPTARATPRMVPYSCHRRRHSAGSARIAYGVAGAALSPPRLTIVRVPEHRQGLHYPARDGDADLAQILNNAQRLVGQIPPDGHRAQDGLVQPTDLIHDIADGHDDEHPNFASDASA